MLGSGPREISFTDPQAWDDIYNRREKEAEFTRNARSWLPGLPRTASIFNSDGEDHEAFRRHLSHVLSEPALPSYEPLIQSHADSLVSEIIDRAQPPYGIAIVRIDSWLSFVTYDIMHQLGTGERSGCVKTDRHQAWLDLRFKAPQWALGDLAARLVPKSLSLWKGRPPASLRQEAPETFFAIHGAFHRTLNGNEKSQDPNFVTRLAEIPFKDGNTVANLEPTFLAMHLKGSEATATILSGILHYLVKENRNFGSTDLTPLEILTKEIRTTFESRSDISDDGLRQLPYLNAVIQEGLRLCQPFPKTFARYVPPEGAVVCGQDLAANTPVSINRFHVCRSNSYFTDAVLFKPGRWLRQSEKFAACEHFPKHDANVSHPFGFGNGKCPGEGLANMMMRMILAKVLWHFDLFKAEPMPSWENEIDGVVVQRRPWAACLRMSREEWEKQRLKIGWAIRKQGLGDK